MPFIKAVTVKALAGREGRALVLAGQKQGLGALGPIARRVSAWRTVRRPGALQTTAATSRHVEEGAGREGDGPARALPEAAVFCALGDVVCPLQKGLLPLQLAGAERLGVHLVFCRKGGGSSERGANRLPGTRTATDALPGRISIIVTHRRAPARNPVATHTCPRKTSLARWSLNAPAGRGPRLRVAHAA